MPRRILFLAWAPFFSGAERALLLTVRHLDPARYVPHVIVGTDAELAAAFRAEGIRCDVVPLRHLDRRHPIAWARSVLHVAAVARRVGASLIHSNDVPSFQPGGYAARLLGFPAVTHVRFPDDDAGYSWFLRPGFARALFVSEDLRTFATGISPALFTGRSDVLYDGVVLPDPVSNEERLAIRRELGLPDTTPVVALTGQISEVKGIWDFVDAAKLVVESGADVVFAVLGDDLKGGGALRVAMEERVRGLGLALHFRFLGFRRDAPRLIPAFDIVAVPSHVEPLGNATLEAMAAGRPVVGSNVGGIPEMIVNGETGILVTLGDSAGLAEAMLRLALDPVRREQLGLSGRARAEGVFGLAQHTARLQAAYDALLGVPTSG